MSADLHGRTGRFGTPKSLYVNLALLAIDLVVIAAT